MKTTTLLLILNAIGHTSAFSPLAANPAVARRSAAFKTTTLKAGGFEWEDPAEEFDQGVENPFKNPELMRNEEGELKIDPARLLGPRLSGTNLYFIGMMGSGKSSVGDVVARRMGSYNFLDTDDIIEKATGVTIPKIFESEGEDAFRNVEAQVLDSVHAYVRCVISTGGGLVCRMQNWSKLQTGIVVFLDVDPEVIMKRIEGTDRPLLQTEDPLKTLTDLLDERRTKYEQADITVEITASMDEEKAADEVVEMLHNFIDDNPPAWKKAKAKAQEEGLDWVQ
jgi:shikimate kinase